MSDGDLRKIFKKAMPQGDWQPIETGAIARGVPDVNCCWDGKEFWIENKFTKAFNVRMRPEQVGWVERRMRHGGHCYIAVRRVALAGTRRIAADELWLLHGLAARPLITGIGLDRLAHVLVLGHWGNGPSAWPWATVAALLKSR